MVRYTACGLLFSLLMYGFTNMFGFTNPGQVDHEEMMNEITNQVLEEICQRFDVSPCGTGGGAMDVIRNFRLEFDIFRPVTKEEARRIVVECTEIFLQKANEAREARPFFVAFPLDVSHIGFTFYVLNPNTGAYYFENSVSLFKLGDSEKGDRVNDICYLKNDNQEKRSTKICQESFEAAQKVVQEERKQDPTLMQQLYKKSYLEQKNEKSKEGASFISRMTDLIDVTRLISGKGDKYFGPPEERAMCWSLDTFCKKLAKKHHLQFFRVGSFSPFSSNYHYTYGFSFLGSEKLSLKEARLLGAEIMQSVMHTLNTDKTVYIYRKKYSEEGHYWVTDPDKDIPFEKICMKIVFWDKNNDRILPPNIAQIAFLEKQLQYFEADPQTQKLRLVFSESYEDAMKFLEKEQQK